VTLTVTDKDGLTNSDTTVITVNTIKKPGIIEVKSTPSHAKIYINGIDTQKFTTWTFNDLRPGNYKVYVTLEGYKTPEIKTVKVAAGKTMKLNFNLKKL
jgi:hypothetical protein